VSAIGSHNETPMDARLNAVAPHQHSHCILANYFALILQLTVNAGRAIDSLGALVKYLDLLGQLSMSNRSGAKNAAAFFRISFSSFDSASSFFSWATSAASLSLDVRLFPRPGKATSPFACSSSCQR